MATVVVAAVSSLHRHKSYPIHKSFKDAWLNNQFDIPYSSLHIQILLSAFIIIWLKRSSTAYPAVAWFSRTWAGSF